MYVIVSPSDVKFREKSFALKAFNDVGDKGERVVVAYGPFVQDMVIHDGSELPILLLSIEQG